MGTATISPFKNYRGHLLTEEIFTNYQFDKKGKVFFHWSNWKISIEHLREEFLKIPVTDQLLNKKLESLQRVPIWIKNKKGEQKISLYELYNIYTDPKFKSAIYNVDNGFFVSMTGPMGPYSALLDLRWFNKDTYSLFIFYKLLKNEYPTRSFRLNTNIKTEWIFNGNNFLPKEVKLHQLSKDGILFECDPKVGETLKKSRILSFSIPFADIYKALYHGRKSYFPLKIGQTYIHSIKTSLSLDSFKNTLERSISTRAGRTYIFIKYSQMPNGEGIKSTVESILEGSQNFLLDQFEFAAI